MKPFWRRRMLPALLGLFALNAAVFLAFTLPRSMQARSQASRLSALRGEVARERARVEDLRRREAILVENAAARDRLYGELIGDRRQTMVAVLKELGALATGLGLRLERQGYSWEDEKGLPLQRLVVQLPVAGSYGQLTAFLGRLEEWSRFATVDTVTLRGRGGADAALDIALSIYFRAEPGRLPESGGRGVRR